VKPFVSVIIATRNRAALLGETLDALAAQRWPSDRFELIIADNGSTDQTRATVARAASRPGASPIQYLYVGQPGKSEAVNAALRIARGDLIALTDDDALPVPGWIESLAKALDETGADFVAGRILPRWETPPPAWVSPSLYGVLSVPDNGRARLDISGSDEIMALGVNMAVRASVVKHLGGLRTDLGKLDGTLRGAEDHEFFLRLRRAGCRGVYEPTAEVRHWVARERLDRGYLRRWLYQNGRNVARLEAIYPPCARRLWGIPRYRWREAAADAGQATLALLTADPRRRAVSTGRLIWFAAYLRESWTGGPSSPVTTR
jgi:glycosyltransferase involved in cell wall biosynthesis